MTPKVFTIPPHRAFADALAAGLIARHGGGAIALAQGIVLVPNNRAARAIQDAFVRRSGGGLLLPRLVPVGDPELDERLGGMLEPMDGDAVPPAIRRPASSIAASWSRRSWRCRRATARKRLCRFRNDFVTPDLIRHPPFFRVRTPLKKVIPGSSPTEGCLPNLDIHVMFRR